MRHTLAVVLLGLGLFTACAVAPSKGMRVPASTAAENSSWSVKLQAFEEDTRGQKNLADAENARTNALLKTSANYRIMEDYFKATLAKSRILAAFDLDAGGKRQLELISPSFDKPAFLQIRDTTSGKKQTVFSATQLSQNYSVSIVTANLSPGKRYAIVLSEARGSIDDFQIHAVDLKQPEHIIGPVDIIGNARDFFFAWSGKNKFSARDKDGYFEFDLDGQRDKVRSDYALKGDFPVLVAAKDDHYSAVTTGKDGNSTRIDLDGLTEYADSNVVGHEIDFFLNGDQPKVLRYDLSSRTAAPSTLFTWSKGVFRKSFRIGSRYFILSTWGPDQTVLVINDRGQQLDAIKIPQFVAVADIFESSSSAGRVSFVFSSPVVPSLKYDYDLARKKWLKPITERDALMRDRILYDSVVEMVTVRDGTEIPVRLTYKHDLKFDESTPFLAEVYGGYGIGGASGIVPLYDMYKRDLFMRNGGVAVAIALRGGNEYGPEWHTSAAGDKRATTLHDLADVFQHYIDQHRTSRRRIITTGTSAGGFVTMAAALASPGIFGLVLPVSGPMDIVGKHRLDERFYTSQIPEYGDPKDAQVVQYMKTYSPLEVSIPTDIPRTLMFAGLDDSRVNHLHTLKLVEKLRTTGSDAWMNSYFTKNAGHWEFEPLSQHWVAWRENVVLWTTVYDFLGWKMPADLSLPLE